MTADQSTVLVRHRESRRSGGGTRGSPVPEGEKEYRYRGTTLVSDPFGRPSSDPQPRNPQETDLHSSSPLPGPRFPLTFGPTDHGDDGDPPRTPLATDGHEWVRTHPSTSLYLLRFPTPSLRLVYTLSSSHNPHPYLPRDPGDTVRRPPLGHIEGCG